MTGKSGCIRVVTWHIGDWTGSDGTCMSDMQIRRYDASASANRPSVSPCLFFYSPLVRPEVARVQACVIRVAPVDFVFHEVSKPTPIRNVAHADSSVSDGAKTRLRFADVFVGRPVGV